MRFVLASLACALFLSGPTRASAQTAQSSTVYDEMADFGGDVGALPGAHADLRGQTVTTITGEMPVNGDVDLFRITIEDAASFSATTEVNPGTHPDTRLFLFDNDGRAVYFNGDSPGLNTSRSTLPAGHPLGPQTGGNYYLAVGMYEVLPIAADSSELFENPRDFGPDWDRINGPASTEPLHDWLFLGPGTNEQNGTYTLTLTGVGATALAQEPTLARNGFAVSAAYPNPVSGVLTVDVESIAAGPVEAVLYDLLGRRVARTQTERPAAGTMPVRLNTAALTAGVYVLRVSSKGGVATRRVTVAR